MAGDYRYLNLYLDTVYCDNPTISHMAWLKGINCTDITSIYYNSGNRIYPVTPFQSVYNRVFLVFEIYFLSFHNAFRKAIREKTTLL